MTVPKLRVARPTDNIEALIPFYRDGLGLDVLWRFKDHDGFDGVMLGLAGAPYHSLSSQGRMVMLPAVRRQKITS